MSMFRRDIIRSHCDEKIFLFFSVNKLNDTTCDQVKESNLLILQFLEIILGDQWFAFLKDDQRPTGTPTISMDDSYNFV